MAEILYGKAVTESINEGIKEDVQMLGKVGVKPLLAIVRVGENESDLSYERGAVKRCESLGVEYKKIVLDTDVCTEEVLSVIRELNEDRNVHGVLLFRPLPKGLDAERIENALSPEKDVDCMTDVSIGSIFTGKNVGFPPCTPQACMEILKYYGYELEGKNVVVVGRSLVVGKPVAMMCMKENATVTICHTRTKNMGDIISKADIVIAAVGHAGAVKSEYISKGQVVIDVGINVDDDGRLCGDVEFEGAVEKAAAITPVPGGVGGVTTSVLLSHVTAAAKKMTAEQ